MIEHNTLVSPHSVWVGGGGGGCACIYVFGFYLFAEQSVQSRCEYVTHNPSKWKIHVLPLAHARGRSLPIWPPTLHQITLPFYSSMYGGKEL